jgi:hypothetical protein
MRLGAYTGRPAGSSRARANHVHAWARAVWGKQLSGTGARRQKRCMDAPHPATCTHTWGQRCKDLLRRLVHQLCQPPVALLRQAGAGAAGTAGQVGRVPIGRCTLPGLPPLLQNPAGAAVMTHGMMTSLCDLQAALPALPCRGPGLLCPAGALACPALPGPWHALPCLGPGLACPAEALARAPQPASHPPGRR